jgi:hypothetical protein
LRAHPGHRLFSANPGRTAREEVSGCHLQPVSTGAGRGRTNLRTRGEPGTPPRRHRPDAQPTRLEAQMMEAVRT